MNRRIVVGAASAGVVIVAVVSGGLLLWKSASSGGKSPAATPPAMARVERRTLSATTQVDGTLGYDGSYSVANMLTRWAARTVPTS